MPRAKKTKSYRVKSEFEEILDEKIKRVKERLQKEKQNKQDSKVAKKKKSSAPYLHDETIANDVPEASNVSYMCGGCCKRS